MATMTIIHDTRGVKSQQGRGRGAAGQSAGGLTPLFPPVYLFNHKRAICAGLGVQHAPMLLAIRRGELSDKNPGHWDKCQPRLPGNWKPLQLGGGL